LGEDLESSEPPNFRRHRGQGQYQIGSVHLGAVACWDEGRT
jgi:hypothetical protein